MDEKTTSRITPTVAQQIQLAISQAQIPHSTSEVSEIVTLSMGAVSVIPTPSICSVLPIALADEALYEAKQRGRNCCVTKSYSLSDRQLETSRHLALRQYSGDCREAIVDGKLERRDDA